MTLTITWTEGAVPTGLPIRQVYGFCLDDAGRCLLISEDDTSFTLPGGKPEVEETAAETLTREVLEEAATVIKDIHIIGYVTVAGSEDGARVRYAQVRAIARIAGFLVSKPDPATGIFYRRTLHHLSDVSRLINWGDHGLAQVATAQRRAREKWDIL